MYILQCHEMFFFPHAIPCGIFFPSRILVPQEMSLSTVYLGASDIIYSITQHSTSFYCFSGPGFMT